MAGNYIPWNDIPMNNIPTYVFGKKTYFPGNVFKICFI